MFFSTMAFFILIFALLAKLAWTDHKFYLLPNVYNLSLLICYLGFHMMTKWHFVAIDKAIWGAIAGGGFLIVLGVLQLTGVWSEWMAAMQALIAGWQPPI